MDNELQEVLEKLKRVEQERDAAIQDMRKVAARSCQKHCPFCKHNSECSPNAKNKRRCYYGDGFEWRGII